MAKKILMIEDDSNIRLLVSRSAKRRAWEFHEAENAGGALARALDVLPDVILLDIQLPDGDGFDVCVALKAHERLSRTPVVMVSGTRLAPEEKARGIEAGADDYVAKPFDPSELWLRIEAILKARG